MNFDEAFDRLIGHEGGYSDHPSDPGGRTMFGVTERVARSHGFTGDMRSLTRDEAKRIYRADYWEPVRAEELPQQVRFDVFDGAVNSGVKQSIKWLQRAANVTDDGIIGPKTLAAVSAQTPDRLAKRYNGFRLEFMTGLANWPSFSRGWARRIASNLQL
ncbi:glycosyl hydrolase 108 family protein [Pseudomonas sp.]|uniref:glycoside hydrolase family 108 protein n=1 Tax=Pseudomonas sp. TaxID=306 RepID=UPI002587ADCC|nr:glycosyl hydrolase 108 family protein [Pseudomonas sp.]